MKKIENRITELTQEIIQHEALLSRYQVESDGLARVIIGKKGAVSELKKLMEEETKTTDALQ